MLDLISPPPILSFTKTLSDKFAVVYKYKIFIVIDLNKVFIDYGLDGLVEKGAYVMFVDGKDFEYLSHTRN